jgi:hypothetical protein
MYQEIVAVIKQVARNKRAEESDSENRSQGVSQPLQQQNSPSGAAGGSVNSGYQRTNKHEYIFQRLRNTLSRVSPSPSHHSRGCIRAAGVNLKHIICNIHFYPICHMPSFTPCFLQELDKPEG